MLIGDLYSVWLKGQTVFHQGKELANAKTWRDRTNAGNRLTVVLMGLVAIAKMLGYNLDIDDGTLAAAGMGIAAVVGVVNNVVTTITHTDMGIKPK